MRIAIVLCLVLATLALYWRGTGNGFVNLDDPGYVTANLRVQGGLTSDNLRWAFTTFEMGNWHPLAWISHMADCQFYGLSPRGHHLTSIMLHALNGALLFLLLTRLTGALWRSALVAALFAVHPLHVESVAWISERKDVLSASFFFLAILSYLNYLARPGKVRYLVVCGTFVAGLLAKPMLVTFPFVLLLLDFWPLDRWLQKGEGDSPLRPIWEKVPLFLIAALSCVVTVLAQRSGQSVASLESVSIPYRLVNAAAAYWGYLAHTFYPAGLVALYPLPLTPPLWLGALGGGAIAALTFLAWRLRRGAPYLMVGWLWFLGTLVPVIGLVQVGVQSMADRYTYLPLIGIFVMLVWGGADLLGKKGCPRGASAGCCVLILAALSALTVRQIGHWKDSVELFSHTLAHTRDNFSAHVSLGIELASLGRGEEAASHYREALRITPDNYLAHLNLGVILADQGRADEAMAHYLESLRLNPDCDVTHFHLGVALLKGGRAEDGVSQLRQAVALNPEYFYARYNLGIALFQQGKGGEAIENLKEAVRLNPGFAPAYGNLGLALASAGSLPEAIPYFETALKLDPENAEYRQNLILATRKLQK